MKKIIISCAVILFSLTQAQAVQLEPPESGGKPIDFKLADSNGRQVALSDYSGRQPVLLFFWTTWCPFCRQAMGKIEAEYPRIKKAGWEVLAIDVGESAARVNNFLKSYPVSYKVLLDAGEDTARAYEVMGVPTYFIIDKEGVITFRDNYFPSDRIK